MLRRDFLKRMSVLAALLSARPHWLFANMPAHIDNQYRPVKDPLCTIYRSINGSPEDNLRRVIDMMGGVEKFVESDAVVLIKPNVQWWNQGAPNLSATRALVDLIMNRPGGFEGEVVVSENCHRGSTPWKSQSSGWVPPFERNSDVPDIRNMSELCAHLKRKYGSRFSTVHLVDVAAGGRRVFSPRDGDGYAYCDGTGGLPLIKCDNGATGGDSRSTIMTYPIFKTDTGTVVDFRNGVWKKGHYNDHPLRFINLAALNHHSASCGATSAVKNYMGISDLSGGPDPMDGGRLCGNYFNFHSFPFNKWEAGPAVGMLGKEIGVFMKTIRQADLNITTAEWVGLTSRTNPPVVRTRAVLASTDAVALDYHAAKYLLYANSRVSIHDPDNRKSPLYQYLMKAAEEGGGVFDEGQVEVRSYDFARREEVKSEGSLAVRGEIEWGSSPRDIAKYLYFRYLHRT
jgi:hypothetical protein